MPPNASVFYRPQRVSAAPQPTNLLHTNLSSRFSLEDTQAASVCISPSCLTWRLASFDGLVPEGHGLRRRAFVEVFVGLVGGVVA